MTILTTEQQVLDLTGEDTLVLWQLDEPFLSTTVYHRIDGYRTFTLYDPEDDFAANSDYENANIWAIATLRNPTSTISLADGTERVTSFEQLADLPRYTVARVGDDIYQWHAGTWMRMDPWSDADADWLNAEQMWKWNGETGDGITILWHPSEAGWDE